MSTGMCFAAALMTRLLILCHEIPVQSLGFSLPVPVLIAGCCETTVEMFS